MLIKCSATMVRFFLFFFPTPSVMCLQANHPVWFVLCVLCQRCATLLTLIKCAHVLLYSRPVCSITVCSMCVCLCVGPEVVDGKGQRPAETQIGGMVMYGNSW